MYRLFLNGLFLRPEEKGKTRCTHDVSVQNLIENCHRKKKKLPTISAIYRIKNGATSIESSILSIAPLATEILVFDNLSSDSSLEIVERLKTNLKGIVEIKLFSYPHQLALAGERYKIDLENENGRSLAEYYNHCFSKGVCDYLMKVDASCIYSFKRINTIQRVLQKEPDIIYFRGCEILGKDLSVEPYIYKRDLGLKYKDSVRFEILDTGKLTSHSRKFIWIPAFLHIKRITYSMFLLDNRKGVSGLYRIKDN